MHKNQIKRVSQVLIITFFVIITVIGGIMASLSILKEETINAKVELAKLQADTFAQSLTQTLNNTRLTFDTLHSVIELHKERLNDSFYEILENNPHIRSINFIDASQTVQYSSNPKNIGVTFSIAEFYPKPMFDSTILRIGSLYKGRDIHESINTKELKTLSNDASTFIPIAQHNGNYTLVLTYNPDYFINKFSSKLDAFSQVDIIRLDNLLLTSSDEAMSWGEVLSDNPILLKAKESSLSQGILNINDSSFIVAYQLTENYPFNISVRINYDQSLKSWESKRYEFFIITTVIIVLCVILVLVLIFMYNQKYMQEIKRHKLQIKNQRKFKVLFENSHFLVCIVSQKGLIEEINQHALKFLKQSHEEVVDTTFWELNTFNENDKAWLKTAILNYKPEDEVYKELHVKNGKGEERVVDFMIFSIEVEGSYELFLISTDITERKRYEYKMKEALAVFENTHDGIVVTDKDGNIINVNPSFELASGYSKHEVLNQNPRILQSGLHEESFYKTFWEDLLRDGSWEGEFINKKKNGQLWTEWLMVNIVRNKEGEITNYIGIFHDTTKQKEQEKELKKKEEILYHQSKMAAMGEMIENIAHQWRQPLSVISSISTGIQLRNEIGDFDKDEAIDSLKTINKTAQYLSKTIDDFRNFLRNDKEKHSFELSNSMEKTLDIVKSKLKNREIEVVKNMNPIEINGFENELIQVFMNIINNARDALEPLEIDHKYIFIEVYERNNKVVIVIKDNAGGIPQEIIEKIFDPYFTTKHKSKGTGIGLYMSDQIIRNHLGGELSVLNQTYEYQKQIYTGACFTIELNK